MAVKKNSVAFKKALISINGENITIDEIGKDDVKTYDLIKILKEFEGIEGISLTIANDTEIPTVGE